MNFDWSKFHRPDFTLSQVPMLNFWYFMDRGAKWLFKTVLLVEMRSSSGRSLIWHVEIYVISVILDWMRSGLGWKRMLGANL